MKQYLYPQNLKATANLWLWSLKDFTLISIFTLLSVLIASVSGFLLPLAAVLGYGFLTIRAYETTVLDYIKYAVRYFISTQQYFEWMQTEAENRLNIYGGISYAERKISEKKKKILSAGNDRY